MSAQTLRLPQRRANDSTRHHDGSPDDDERYDLFAGLWQESLFVRLPADAPPELKPFVRDIENPRRVYAIHRASRRHDFQLLVQLYIHQLRDGCGSDSCTTPTCFSCRKRLVGKAPIRRYNPTSARTLAVYLASQDDPERGICPSLRRPRDITPAVNNLVFSKCSSSKPTAQKSGCSETLTTTQRPTAESQPRNTSALRSRDTGALGEAADGSIQKFESSHRSTDICVSEQPVTRDHRSFAATTFGTVAFKMLEWLAPNSLDTLSKKISDLDSPSQSTPELETTSSSEPQVNIIKDARDHDNSVESSLPPYKASSNPDTHGVLETRNKKDQSTPKRNSKPSFRSKTAVETTRRKSIEPVCVTAEADNTSLHRSNRMSGYHPDKLSRRTISPTTITFQPAFFENVPIPPSVTDEVTLTSSEGEESTKEEVSKPTRPSSNLEHRQKQQAAGSMQDQEADDEKAMEYPLPQALSRLNLEIVNFICDVYDQDQTAEDQFFGTLDISRNYPKPKDEPKHLMRKSQRRDTICKGEWKAFHEQTLFSVLSDPAALVSSFTNDGKLFDSQSLWYSLVRLTRASPSLVLHSLWMSAASLFSFSEVNSKREDGKSRRLSASQADNVMSICLHALVALVPVAPDSRTLYDLSRIRSHGLTLANSSASYRLPYSLCMEYDDVFSNSLALRLARRLFLSITIRQQHAKAPLGSLLKQLDLRNAGRERILEFAQEEHLLHETRVPTLLLDWARAVLLHEWDGNAQFYKDGTFYGALSFMDTLCKFFRQLIRETVAYLKKIQTETSS